MPILFIYLFIWLCQVLDVAGGLLSCGSRAPQLWHANSQLRHACGIQLPNQGSNPGPLHQECGVNHCATREVPTCLLEWPKSRIPTTPSASEDVEQQELSFIAGGNEKMVQALWKTVSQFLIKSNSLLLYDPAMLLGIYSNELKIYIYPKTYTQMFIAVLFIIAKTWKQLRSFSVGKWINKLWYIQTMEYYSVLKRNELSNYLFSPSFPPL